MPPAKRGRRDFLQHRSEADGSSPRRLPDANPIPHRSNQPGSPGISPEWPHEARGIAHGDSSGREEKPREYKQRLRESWFTSFESARNVLTLLPMNAMISLVLRFV